MWCYLSFYIHAPGEHRVIQLLLQLPNTLSCALNILPGHRSHTSLRHLLIV
jgi:hypothetical protein